jgi:glycosyltransferase involved in cell wall biosynthesis
MVERTFGDDVSTYTAGDADDLVLALLHLVDDPAARDDQVARAFERVRDRLSWEGEARRYLGLVDRLVRR